MEYFAQKKSKIQEKVDKYYSIANKLRELSANSEANYTSIREVGIRGSAPKSSEIGQSLHYIKGIAPVLSSIDLRTRDDFEQQTQEIQD